MTQFHERFGEGGKGVPKKKEGGECMQGPGEISLLYRREREKKVDQVDEKKGGGGTALFCGWGGAENTDAFPMASWPGKERKRNGFRRRGREG